MNKAGRLLLVLAALAAPLPAETVRSHFDSDALLRAPGFFDFVVLAAPGDARWLVLTDDNAPSASNRLVQVNATRPADSIAAAVRRNYPFADGTVSAFLKQGSSRAGLLLRLSDEKDFLALLVNTATGEAVLWSYRGGRGEELGRGRMKFAEPWTKVSVKAEGPSLAVFAGEEKLFEAADPKPASGRAGLATAGPGEASFDEFILDFTPAPARN